MPLRSILINRGRPDEHILEYDGNAVYTTKYSIWTFIPKFFFEQFSRYANLFFLVIACIQQIPGITPISRWGTAVPLSIIIFITGVKEVVEDVRRKRADDKANNAPCEVFNRSKKDYERKKWEQVRVGDIVRVCDGQEFPADLILVASSAEEGTCFVETSNIDGETNLKTRERVIVPIIPTDLCSFQGLLKCDEPNNRIYDFEGLMVVGEHEISIGPNQILLRGSRLQNTAWILGVVVYTGRDTKIVMNSRTTRIKRSSIEKMTNRQIIYLFLLLLLVVSFCFGAFWVTARLRSVNIPYLYASYELTPMNLLKKFFTFLVLMNNLVPISLIMTMELIRIRLGSLIDEDVDLYCEETDTPAVAKTTSLVEELGQVQYIFSDKTGTLTRNEMILRQLVVRGETITDVEDNVQIEEYPGLEQLLLIMATCNTAIVGRAPDGTVTYQSSSPDEVAIVQAAAGLGTALADRKLASVTVKVLSANGLSAETTTFSIITILEFDSARKRMSVLMRDSDGQAWLFSKGADAVMWPRLASGQNAEELRHAENVMGDMALIGLRTLVFAYRTISEEELSQWLPRWKQAQMTTQKRKEAMDQVMDQMEQNLILAGASGVEDRLQEAVPETIEKLHGACIRLWVLTGDKLETAVNIGYSCRLLNPATQLLQLSYPEGLESALAAYKINLHGQGVVNAAIVVEARTLQVILEDERLQTLFVDTTKSCRTVICCRVSPSQKAKVVEMVQKREKAVCLAIGDGANDVSMIQAAQIGVGISGKEGLQAARSADFSIAQFRFLQKLLLVHGAWGYHRISKAAIFCVYKNILLYACQLWYAFVTLFSGQTIFESWMIGLYNVVFTAWPPIVIGLTDQFVTARFLLSHPALYRLGQQNSFYNKRTFWQSAVNGFAQSLIAFTLTAFIFFRGTSLEDGHAVGLFFMGTVIFAGIVLTCVLKAALLINYWTLFSTLGLIVCPISWLLYVIFYDWISYLLGSPASFSDLLGMSRPLFQSALFWLTSLLIPIVCLLRDFIWKFYQRQFMPQEYHIVQELQREEKHSFSRSHTVEGTASTTMGSEKLHSRSLTLAKARVERRATWEATKSANPQMDFVGTCLDMCPEFERHEREAHFDLSQFETLDKESLPAAPGITARIDHRRAVKKYHRPAAGNEAPLPEDVRPPSVLRRTMDYLLALLDTPDDRFSFSDKHKFLRDRTRSIRQDIILQQRAIHRDPQALLTVVRLHEEMARFHILSGHRLCELDFADFDPFQNTEQLRKVLQSLQEFYTDIRALLNRSVSNSDPQSSCILREALQNEAEFRSYVLLTHAEDQDVFRQSLSFPPEIFEAPAVQLALLCVSTLHRGEYVTYFRQVTGGATYLQACLLQTHFVRVRQRALQVLIKAYTAKEFLPAALLMRWLLLTDGDELISLLSHQKSSLRLTANGQLLEWGNPNGDVGAPDDGLIDGTTGEDVVSLSATTAASTVKARTNRYIEDKVMGLSPSHIIYGISGGGGTLSVISNSMGTGVGPIKAVPNTMNLVRDSLLSRTIISSPPPPPAPSHNLDDVARRLAEELLAWCLYHELLPELIRQALNRERLRRATLKAHTIEAVLNALWEMLLGELVREVCVHQLVLKRECRAREAYRGRRIREIAGDLSEQILSEVVRDGIEEQQQLIISLMQTPLKASSQPSHQSIRSSSQSAELASASSVLMTPGARRRKLLAHSKLLEMCTLDSIVLGGSEAPSTLADQLSRLARSASSERLASQHLDDLIKKATTM